MLYLPFGEAMAHQKIAGWETPYTFTGKEQDAATGLHYFCLSRPLDERARYLDTRLSMWFGVDPLADAPSNIGYNSYHYTWNNPIKFLDPDGRHGESTHTDADGNIIAVYNDGDLGVYSHKNGTTKDQIDNARESSCNTSGNGKLMGETNYWWDFAAIDTKTDIVSESPAPGARIHFGKSMDHYLSETKAKAISDMPTSVDPTAAGNWLANNSKNGEDLDIKTKIGPTDGYLFGGKYVSGRALGNQLFGSLLRETRPFYIAPRTWFTNTMNKVGNYNQTQNNTTFPSTRPFYGENKISGIYIARGYWGKNWQKAGNYSGNYGY